jgi:release factor glutamine methyltransferase
MSRMDTTPARSVEALVRAGVRLLEAHSDSPRLDTELLIAHALGWSRAALYARRSEPLEPAASARCLALLHERQTGRPVAQIVGEREFWSLPLRVTPDVLTPRPETELLVERALTHLPEDEPARVLDLGTGSGAVALAIATERPAAVVHGTDVSAAALAVARQNAARTGLGQVTFSAGDWFAAASGQYDVIVSNPPYIGDTEWPAVAAALRFEPRIALTSGTDGLDAIRRIVAGSSAFLAPGGWLVLEHGRGQASAVQALLNGAGFIAVTTALDLARHPRVTEGQLASA